jgi:hypothetical protein
VFRPFTQQDPIGIAGGLNLYGYANGDPVNYSDPFGLCPEFITGRPCGTAFAIGVGFVPVIGDAIDIIGALAGRDLLTGEDIGGVGVGVTIAGTIFGGSGKLAREGADLAGDAIRRIPGNPFRGANAPQRAFDHLEKYSGLDPNVASARLHRLKRAGNLGGDDDVVIGRTGDVYNALTGEHLGTLTDTSLGGR